MGPPPYMRSVIDRIIGMWCMTIHGTGASNGAGHFPKEQQVYVT